MASLWGDAVFSAFWKQAGEPTGQVLYEQAEQLWEEKREWAQCVCPDCFDEQVVDAFHSLSVCHVDCFAAI